MVRVKERYLLVNILYPGALQTNSKIPDFVALNRPTTDTLTPSLLIRGIKAEIKDLFGDYGAGAVERSMSVKYLSHATSTFILRVSRDHYRLLWAALTFMKEVPVRGGEPCFFRVVRVSGTIRKVELEAIRRAKSMILAAQGQMTGKAPDSLSALFGGSKDPITNTAADIMTDTPSDTDDVDSRTNG